MTLEVIIKKLKAQANPKNVIGMARFGIKSDQALGVSIPFLRALAKNIGHDHSLALSLWQIKIHEAKILAALIDDYELVTEKQMESWVKGFDSWDVCDQVCSNLFDRTPFAWIKAIAWSSRQEEYVKRAGFVLMAVLAVHDKKTGDKSFLKFFPYLKKESIDSRNFVKKSINWALRQIGKRSLYLNGKVTKLCLEIQEIDSSSAKWIATDALRELKEKAQKLAKK